MRISLLIFASLGLICSTSDFAQAPSAATSLTAHAGGLGEVATWEPRTLKGFGKLVGASCDDLVEQLTFVLQNLGARDLKIDQRGCVRRETSVDATFSVLARENKSDVNANVAMIEARWQIVEIKINPPGHLAFSDCAGLRYITQKVLPLFSTRDVKLISNSVCNKTDVGLRAEVLVPVQQSADAR